MGDLIGALLFAVLFPLGMWALFRFSRRVPEVEGDGVVLRYGPAVAVMGWLCLGLGALMLGAVAVGETSGEPAFVVVLVVAVGLGFAVGGAHFVRAHRSEYVRFSAAGIEGRSGWRKEMTALRWSEIEQARFHPTMGVLALHARGGRVLRVSPLMSGTDELVRLLGHHVRADGVAEAVDAFRQYQRAYGGGAKR